VLGLLAGFIGSKIVNKQGEGLILDILLGIVGALVGGWLFNTFGASGVTGLSPYRLWSPCSIPWSYWLFWRALSKPLAACREGRCRGRSDVRGCFRSAYSFETNITQ
jgi:fructose-specific phosphotransferase system IIC component